MLTGLAVDTSTGHTYAASGEQDAVFDVRGSGSMAPPILVGDWPSSLAYVALTGALYSVNQFADTVSVLNTTTDQVAQTISLGNVIAANPSDIVYARGVGELYIAVNGCLCSDPGEILILNSTSNQIVGSIQDWAGPGPSSIAVDGQDSELYVTDDYSNLLWAFNLSTGQFISVTNVGVAPEGVVLDPLNGFLYVTNSGSNNVSVVNSSTNTLLGSIQVGSDPLGLAFDPLNDNVYVANEGSGSISVIGGAFAPVAAFRESGLPTGTDWWVNVTGQPPHNSTGSTISLALADGTYTYSVAAATRQFVAANGTLVLSGAAVSVEVRFAARTYQVTFVETGLPSGTQWEVSLNGTPMLSTNQWINFTEVDGTYPYVTGPQYWYAAAPATGEVVVAGANKSVRMLFSHVLDQFVVSEKNLPARTNWSMTIGSVAEWSTRPSLGFNLTNGTYSYWIPTVDGYLAAGLTSSDSNSTALQFTASNASSGRFPIYTRWVNATVIFGKQPAPAGPASFGGLSEVDWIGLGAVLVGLVTFGILFARRRKPPRILKVASGSRSQKETRVDSAEGR